MRGTVPVLAGICRKHGITPAHAGNSPDAGGSALVKGDHPRSCGEQDVATEMEIERRGSPPLMRGTVFVQDVLHICPGITPAHAGNSRRVAQRCRI